MGWSDVEAMISMLMMFFFFTCREKTNGSRRGLPSRYFRKERERKFVLQKGKAVKISGVFFWRLDLCFASHVMLWVSVDEGFLAVTSLMR